MRKSDGARDIHVIALARTPHRAREITQPIGGEQRGLVEWRNKKRAREVGLMMFDAIESRMNLIRRDVERLSESLWNSHESCKHFCSLAGKTRHFQRVKEFRAQACPGVAWNRDVIHVRERYPSGVQTIPDGRRRKSRGVLHAVEPAFFDGRNQAAVGNKSLPKRCHDRR